MAEVIEATKTHAVILAPRLRKEDIEEIKGIDHLLSTIEDWLRVDRDETKARKLLEGPKKRVDPYAHFGSRQMSYYGC